MSLLSRMVGNGLAGWVVHALIALLLCMSSRAAAQTTAASGAEPSPLVDLSRPGAAVFDLVDYGQFLTAPAETPPERLASPPLRDQFLPLSGFQAPDDERAVWVRLRLRGPTSEPWLLTLAHGVLRGWRVTLYQQQQGRWLATPVSRWTPLRLRPTHDAGAVFPLGGLGPQPIELYLCLERSIVSNLIPYKKYYSQIVREKDFNFQKSAELLIFGILIGTLLIMAIYNGFIFISERDRSYLWFSVTLIGYALYYIEIWGVATDFFMYDPPWISLTPICSLIGCILMVLGFTMFLFSYIRLGREYRITRIGTYAIIAIIVISLSWAYVALYLGRRSDFRVFNYSALVLVGVCALIMLRSALKRQREALFFLAASVAPIVGIVVQILLNVGLVSGSVWSRYSMPVGIMVQVVVMAVALADRLRLARLSLIEREKSERLLLTMLPAPIADRLKAGESPIADRHAEVTVLFADIAGFTPLSAALPPERLVLTLNRLFSRFDALTRERGLEKIKTIGDCYMVVGGLPLPRADHIAAVADLALALLDALHEVDTTAGAAVSVRVRIGIHCGSAVAGVIGTTKPAYDLWGDTVNTASRMESHGEPGRIHCTEAVYEQLRDSFEFSERGEIEIRGKGRMRTFFLVGRRGAGGLPAAPSSPTA